MTATATCEDGTLMVSGFDSGITWIFVVESAGEEVRVSTSLTQLARLRQSKRTGASGTYICLLGLVGSVGL